MMPCQTMLFSRFFVGIGLYVCAVALAEPSMPLDVQAERLRIDAERSQHEAAFAVAERDCYRRFAVSDCLSDARHARRMALDELRRQEIVLNDQNRKTRAGQALQRIQTNISDNAPTTSDAR